MPPEDLERHLRPFAPFRIQLSTGETIDVRHPELVMVGKRSAIIGISNASIFSLEIGSIWSSTSEPRIRSVAGLPTWRCKSEPLCLIICRKILLISSSL